MKKSFFFSLLLSMILSTPMFSQWHMTAMAGISPQQTPTSHYIFVNRSTPNEFRFDLSRVKSSLFIGAGARYDIQPFFFQAEAQYNEREYVYDITYTYAGHGRTEQSTEYTEKMNVINIPLSVGVDLGFVDVTSGFLPQIILSQQTDLSDLTGYHQDLKTFRFGWQSGLAFNVNQLRLGLNWQMDFNNYVDHAYIQDQSLELQGRSSRLLGTVGFVF